MNNQESSSKTWIVGCLSAAAVIIAAIIGLGAPFAERLADVYFPSPTPVINSIPPTQITIATVPPQSTSQPTSTNIALPTQPQSSGVCQESGGASGFPLPPTPSAPVNGCVLIVEWWVPPDSSNCGILITTQNPVLPTDSIGAWWYVYPQRPDSHIKEFLAKNPHCKVEDLR